MTPDKDFNRYFVKTSKGNYYSKRDGITIYKKSRYDMWAYIMKKDHVPVYGRLEFETPQECFQWIIRRRILS